MTEHGRAWQSMAEHGRAWQSMAEHDRAWQSMTEHGIGEEPLDAAVLRSSPAACAPLRAPRRRRRPPARQASHCRARLPCGQAAQADAMPHGRQVLRRSPCAGEAGGAPLRRKMKSVRTMPAPQSDGRAKVPAEHARQAARRGSLATRRIAHGSLARRLGALLGATRAPGCIGMTMGRSSEKTAGHVSLPARPHL
jgi:hypothetical protein